MIDKDEMTKAELALWRGLDALYLETHPKIVESIKSLVKAVIDERDNAMMTRDKWIVENGHWSDFVSKLPSP